MIDLCIEKQVRVCGECLSSNCHLKQSLSTKHKINKSFVANCKGKHLTLKDIPETLKIIEKNLAASKTKPNHKNNKPQAGGNTANIDVNEVDTDGEDPSILANESKRNYNDRNHSKVNAVTQYQVDISALPIITEDNLPKFSEMEETTAKNKT